MKNLLTTEVLIKAYADGFFPMAESKDGDIYWHSPDPRAIIPLNTMRIPRSMRQIFRKKIFSFTINKNFNFVIKACSEREDTWISDDIIYAYNQLHRAGFAHSVETWCNGEIVGGLYGVAIGGAFFGESMFNIVNNASKAAFYFLMAKLNQNGFILLDSQYINDFTEQLGAIEIPREDYLKILKGAIQYKCEFS